ncbi:hypothetical protein BGX33_009628 [Mortierella sp. NVP41]|nr:hypothetical protein BGX33_009628 [Mortierella sp. NVP41]
MYTKSDEEADQWLNSNPSKMYALDAEWKAFGQYGKQCRMSLIQLGDDRTVYLFHVIHMKKFPEALARILQDKSILKVGINIRNDGTKMFKDWGIGCASLVELGALCVQVLDDLPNQRKIRSMERLANELLGHSVEKMSLLRMGNWESKNLSANQLAYAANDVFVTYEVAEKIKELQRSRSKQEFWVPLATIHSKGATVVTVRGSLQERQDHPASTKDIVVLKSGAGATAAASKAEMQEKSGGVKRSTGYTKVSSAKVAGSSPTSRRKNANAASSTSSAATAPTTATGASTKAPSKATKKTAAKAFKRISPKPPNRSAMVTAATSSSNDLQSPPPTPPPYSYMSVNGDPNFFYGNIGSNTSTSGTNNVIRAIRHGSRSTVTIIPAKSQKRYISCSSQRPSSSSSSSSSTLTTEGDKAETKDDSERKQNGVRGGDVYFPSQLLPESLEGKGTLERNQSIWQEAGGRDLSEELGSALEEEQDDWYLRQNQALFASLVSDEEKEK